MRAVVCGLHDPRAVQPSVQGEAGQETAIHRVHQPG